MPSPSKKLPGKIHTLYHRDGSVWGKGRIDGQTMVGYWQWFRKDGSLMRSGSFENGRQIGAWTTYDKKGQAYKVTQIKKLSKKKKST